MGTVPFLLIYDNANGPDSVKEWLPPAGGGGAVLVTSTWDRWNLRWHRVPVPPMAQSWYERAVAEKEQGDVYGRIDHESLALSRARLSDARAATQSPNLAS